MYLHIPVHGNIQVNICLILGCWGGIFFFSGIKAVVGIMNKRSIFFIMLFKSYLLILAALNLQCCSWAFSSCSDRGYSLVVVLGLLIVVASLVAEHQL